MVKLDDYKYIMIYDYVDIEGFESLLYSEVWKVESIREYYIMLIMLKEVVILLWVLRDIEC